MKRMIRKIIVIGIGAVLFAAAWPLYNLGVAFRLWQPLRPAGVSPSARYVSLIEDGTWFDCTVDSQRNVNVCRAWNTSGKLVADGQFRLEGDGRAAIGSELRPSRVLGTDGKAYMIYLFGEHGALSRALVPVPQIGNR